MKRVKIRRYISPHCICPDDRLQDCQPHDLYFPLKLLLFKYFYWLESQTSTLTRGAISKNHLLLRQKVCSGDR